MQTIKKIKKDPFRPCPACQKRFRTSDMWKHQNRYICLECQPPFDMVAQKD